MLSFHALSKVLMSLLLMYTILVFGEIKQVVVNNCLCLLKRGLSIVPMLTRKDYSDPAYTASVCKLLRTIRNMAYHFNDQ